MTSYSSYVPRLLIVLAMLALSTLGAWANGGKFPVVTFITTNDVSVVNVTNTTITMSQGTPTNTLFFVSDDAVGWSQVASYTATFATTNLLSTGTTMSFAGITNSLAPTNYSNIYYETNILAIHPGPNIYGTNIIIIVATDLWGDTSTNRVNLAVVHVSQPPSFALTTNVLAVMEESGLQTNAAFVTGITNGAGNPPGLTWKFTTTVAQNTNGGINYGVNFTVPPTITNYNSTSGLTAPLVFAPAAHSYGSNLVTVVMTDSGTPIGAGSIAATNKFWLVVSKIAHAPVFGGVTMGTSTNAWGASQTVLENSLGTNAVVSVQDDVPGNATLTLTALSLNPGFGSVSVSATNVIGSLGTTTNTTFNLAFVPVQNTYGTVTNQLIAKYVVGAQTLLATNSLVLNVVHVSQPPSFTFSTNTLSVAEESPSQVVTNFLTNINSGAGNPAGTNWSFNVSYVNTNEAGMFATPPSIAHSGWLTYAIKAHVFGTNVLTVTMKNTDATSTTNNGGQTSYVTNFSLAVVQIPHVPTISVVTNLTLLENVGSSNLVVDVWNYDAISNNLALTVVSAGVSNNASVATARVISTNVVSATNTLFTVSISPVTNLFGANVLTFTAAEKAGTVATTNAVLKLTVSHVTQAPSFVLSANSIALTEQATAVAYTNANFATSITNGAGNPAGTNWSFALTPSAKGLFAAQPAISHNGTLTYTLAAKTNGTSLVTVVMTDGDTGESTASGGVVTATNSFTVSVAYESQTPSFAFATNTLVVPEESAPQTNANFILSINTGLGQPATTTWTFTTITATNNPATNVSFDVLPAFQTNGTLTYVPTAHSYGTNWVTVIMTDSTVGNSCTNSFLLEVAQISHAPQIQWATNQTTLENSSALTSIVNVWDYDSATNLLSLSAFSLNTNLATVSVSSTNWQSATNVQFSLAFTPVLNMYGLVTNQLIASELVGTNVLSTTNYLTLTVAQVSQPPSFTFATNVLVAPEQSGSISIPNFLTNLTAGAGNPQGLTWSFSVTTPTNNPGNVNFAPFQSPAISPNGTLTFLTANYANGTNVVTVVMTDSGIAVNGGVITYTNSFILQVPWVNQAPSFNLASSSVTVNEYNVPVVVSNTAINILAGPPNEVSRQTVSFLVSNNNSNLLVVQPEVDANGTLTFTPGDQGGTVVVQISALDNGGTANGGVDASTNQSFSIIIPPNTFQSATGTYVGLFYATNTLALNSSGYLNLALATNGTFNGYLLCGTDSNLITGQFGISNYSASVTSGNYQLNLTINTATLAIGGAVSNTAALWNSPLSGYLSGYGTALDNTYLGVMPGFNDPVMGTAGDSDFMIGITDGVASFAGNLADLTQASFTGSLCTNGYFPVYAPLYAVSQVPQGLIIGWVNFNNVANESTTPGSTLVWLGQAAATALYPNGFTNQVVPLVSTFASRTQLLPINNGYVEMSGGDLTIPFVGGVTIVNNQIIVDGSVNNGLALTVNTNTGEVQGTFVDGNGNTDTIESVILENENVARGYFQGTGESGSFLLVANAVLPHSPPYPAFIGESANGAAVVAGVTATNIASLSIPENSATNNLSLLFSLYDPLTNAFTVSCASANTGVVAVSLTHAGSQYYLWFAPVTNVYGSNILVTVTASDGTLTNTLFINTTIGYVNQAPSFTLGSAGYTVNQFATAVSIANVASNSSAGPASESWQTVSFTVTNTANNLFLVQPAVDASGTLTFTPGSLAGTAVVSIQALDTGGTAHGGVNVSGAQLFTITIPANPFVNLITGQNTTAPFAGLFFDTVNTPGLDDSGYVSLVMTNSGAFTGYFLCAGVTNAFAGQFPIASLQTDLTVGSYSLSLTLDTVTNTIYGTVAKSGAGWSVDLESYLIAQPSLAGNYNVALPGLANPANGPAGDSIFTVGIDADGVVSLAGLMADSNYVSEVGTLSAQGNCPIYIPLYTNTPDAGLLVGWLNFTNDPNDHVMATSTLTWLNKAGATPLYAAGFTNQTVAVASSYVNSSPNELTGLSFYAVLTGGTFGAASITNAVTILNDNITVDPSATNALQLSINEVTGQITGSFVDGNGTTNYIDGLVLQNTNISSGYFSSADGDGAFALLNNYPAPSNPYPIIFTGVTNVTMFENGATVQMPFAIFDPLTTNLPTVTVVSGNADVTVSLNAASTVISITPSNSFSGDAINCTITATDVNGASNSTNFNVHVIWVNQVPTFTLATSIASGITVNQFNAPVSIANAVTNISPGLGTNSLETSQTVGFTVTNNANGLFVVQPHVDASGTLAFTPGIVGGSVIVGVQAYDNGGLANGGVNTSASQTFSITLPNNIFQNVTGTNVSSTFDGLFYDTNGVVPTSSGYFTLILTNDGTFNVTFLSVGTTNSVIGQFGISGSSATATVNNYTLALNLNTVADTVTGIVTNSTTTWIAELQGYLTGNSVITPGVYGVVLPGFDDLADGPSGDSAFTVGVDSNGVAMLSGFMADNTPVSQVSILSTAGYCPIYIPLYPTGTNGLLIGWLNFTNDPANDSVTDDSTLTWFNAAGATTNLYATGYTNQAVPLASLYLTNANYIADLLGSSSSSGYGFVLLSGGDLGANPVVKKIGITNNVISVVSPAHDHSLSLNIVTNTGLVQGYYLDPNGLGSSNVIEGVILQNGALSSGYFSGANTNQAGLFMMFGN